MRHLNVQVLLPLALLLSACSITQPHPDVTDTLRNSRIIGGVVVEPQMRWVLPNLSRLSLASSEGVSETLERAARNGLSRRFQVNDDAPWQLWVHWPAALVTQPEYEAWGLNRASMARLVPRPARRDLLMVDVVDRSGDIWVQRLQVKVDPALFGQQLDAPKRMEAVFEQIAGALVGG